jgi:hypothetical protein
LNPSAEQKISSENLKCRDSINVKTLDEKISENKEKNDQIKRLEKSRYYKKISKIIKLLSIPLSSIIFFIPGSIIENKLYNTIFESGLYKILLFVFTLIGLQFLAKIFERMSIFQLKEQIIELENLLKSNPIESCHEIIEKLVKKYEFVEKDMVGLKVLNKHIKKNVFNFNFDDNLIKHMNEIAHALLISDTDYEKLMKKLSESLVNKIILNGIKNKFSKNNFSVVKKFFCMKEYKWRRISMEIYTNEFSQILKDGRLDEKSRAKFNDLIYVLSMRKEDAKKIESEIGKKLYDRKLEEIISDEKITKKEEESLFNMADQFGLDGSIVKDDLEKNVLSRLYGAIQENDLPVLESPILLKKNEKCHFIVKGKYLERKKIGIGYSGGRKSVNVKVTDGVSFKIGGHRGKMRYEIKTIKHNGELCVTNKRVVFNSYTKSFQIPFGKLINYSMNSYKIMLFKETEQYEIETFRKMENGVFCRILEKAMLN